MSERIQPVSGLQHDTSSTLSIMQLCNLAGIDTTDLGIPDGLIHEPANNFMDASEIITILEGN